MTRKYYKGRYNIAFYSKNDELLYVFNNLREICQFNNLECNRQNLQYLKLLLYKALKRESHSTKILGKKMKVFIIDITEDEEEEE